MIVIGEVVKMREKIKWFEENFGETIPKEVV